MLEAYHNDLRRNPGRFSNPNNYPTEYDFKYGDTADDLFHVDGRVLRADEFGNFAAGYAAQHAYGGVGHLAMIVGGIAVASLPYSGEHWLDATSRPMINAGARRARAEQAATMRAAGSGALTGTSKGLFRLPGEAALFSFPTALAIVTLATRRSEGINVIHDRNPIFVRLSDGSIRNAYTIRILNKALETRVFKLAVDGVPGLDVTLVGDTAAGGNPLIVVGPDQTRELRALLTTHSTLPGASSPLTFTIMDGKDGSKASAIDHFRGP